MCKLGISHKDDGTIHCRGYGQTMCEFGYSHKDDGTFHCKGCSKLLCKSGPSYDYNPAPNSYYTKSQSLYRSDNTFSHVNKENGFFICRKCKTPMC